MYDSGIIMYKYTLSVGKIYIIRLYFEETFEFYV